MDTVRVVWGTGTGPTPVGAYDAALAAAGVHDYNLVTVSSVLPAGATVEREGTAPPLGRAGDRLTVVEARATAAGPGVDGSGADGSPVDAGSPGAVGTADEAGSGESADDGGVGAHLATAGLAWATGQGAGIVYEASAIDDPEAVEVALDAGLAAGIDLRERRLSETGRREVTARAGGGSYATAVVVAILGGAEPLPDS